MQTKSSNAFVSPEIKRLVDDAVKKSGKSAEGKNKEYLQTKKLGANLKNRVEELETKKKELDKTNQFLSIGLGNYMKLGQTGRLQATMAEIEKNNQQIKQINAELQPLKKQHEEYIKKQTRLKTPEQYAEDVKAGVYASKPFDATKYVAKDTDFLKREKYSYVDVSEEDGKKIQSQIKAIDNKITSLNGNIMQLRRSGASPLQIQQTMDVIDSLNAQKKTLEEQYKNFLNDNYKKNLSRQIVSLESIVNQDDFAEKSTLGSKMAESFDKKAGHQIGKYQFMTTEERAIHNYYLATSKTKAQEYLDSLDRALNFRSAAVTSEYQADVANKNKALGVVMDLGANYMSGIGVLGTGIQDLKNKLTGEYVPDDPYSSTHSATRTKEAAREGLLREIDPSWKRFLAETGLSIGEFLTAFAAGPLALPILASSAAGGISYDSLKRGATTEQAIRNGIIGGAAEAFFERIPIANLYRLAKSGGKGLKNALKETFRQAGIEGSEELATDYAQTVSDHLVMGEKSNYSLMIKDLMAQGMSREEAEKETRKELFVKQPLLSFLAGTISGGVIGGAATTIKSISDALPKGQEKQTSKPILDPAIVKAAGVDSSASSIARMVKNGGVSFSLSSDIRQLPTGEKSALMRSLELAKTETDKTGIIAGASQEQMEVATRLGKQLGKNVYLFNNPATSAGIMNGFNDSGDIYINVSSRNPMAQIFSHELTHSLEKTDIYNDIKSLVVEQLKNGNVDIDSLMAEKRELYARNNIELNDDAVMAEIVASHVETRWLNNENEIKELAKTNQTLAQRILTWIKETLAKLTGNTEKQYLLKAQKIYKKALSEVNNQFSENSLQNFNETKRSITLGGYNPDINITTDNILEDFNITSINDKRHVINKVVEKLKDTYLSTEQISKPIKNIDTGMEIEIWKNGISETFGNDKYYLKKPQEYKLAKLATIPHLAKLIKYGEVRANEAYNKHDSNSKVRYAYLKSPIIINGVQYNVTMDIRRSPHGQNRFYIHDLKIKKIDSTSHALIQSEKKRLETEVLSFDTNVSRNDTDVNNSVRKNSENDTENVSYSVSEPFEEQVDKVLSGEGDFEQTHLYMGKTPKVLTDIGFSQLPMLVTAKHTYLAAKSDGKYHGENDHYHNLGAERVKALPKEIADPVMIMASATKDDSAVILTEVIDEKKRPIIVAVKANGYGNYNDIEIDANIMTSAYGINDFIARAYKEDRILYFNNEKSQLLRKTPGVQFPDNLASADFPSQQLHNRPGVQFPDGLASADFTNSIRKFKEKINKNKKFSISPVDSEGNKLTDAQREYFKDSKVVGFNLVCPPSVPPKGAKTGQNRRLNKNKRPVKG